MDGDTWSRFQLAVHWAKEDEAFYGSALFRLLTLGRKGKRNKRQKCSCDAAPADNSGELTTVGEVATKQHLTPFPPVFDRAILGKRLYATSNPRFTIVINSTSTLLVGKETDLRTSFDGHGAVGGQINNAILPVRERTDKEQYEYEIVVAVNGQDVLVLPFSLQRTQEDNEEIMTLSFGKMSVSSYKKMLTKFVSSINALKAFMVSKYMVRRIVSEINTLSFTSRPPPVSQENASV